MQFKISEHKEVVLHILSFLSSEELLISRLVCRQLKLYTDEEYLWKEQCLKVGVVPLNSDTFKECYFKYFRIFNFFRKQSNFEAPKDNSPTTSRRAICQIAGKDHFSIQLLEQWMKEENTDEETIQCLLENMDRIPSDDILLNQALLRKFSSQTIELLLKKGSLPSSVSFGICTAQKNTPLLEKLYLRLYRFNPVHSSTLGIVLQLRFSEKTVYFFICNCIDPITKLHFYLALNNEHSDAILYSLILRGAFHKVTLSRIPSQKRDLLIALFLDRERSVITKDFLRQFLYWIDTLSFRTVDIFINTLSKIKYKLSFIEFIKLASKEGLNPNAYRQLLTLVSYPSFEKYPFFLAPPVCQALVQAATESQIKLNINSFLILVLVLHFFDSDILKLFNTKEYENLLKFNLQAIFERLFNYILNAETEVSSPTHEESNLIVETLQRLTDTLSDIEKLKKIDSIEAMLEYRAVFNNLCEIQSNFVCNLIKGKEFCNLLSFFEQNEMQACASSTIYAHAEEARISSAVRKKGATLDDLLFAAYKGYSPSLLRAIIEKLIGERELETILALRRWLPSDLFIQLMKKTTPNFDFLVYLLVDKGDDKKNILEACVPKVQIDKKLLKIAIQFEVSAEEFMILLKSAAEVTSILSFAKLNGRDDLTEMIKQRSKFLEKRARGFRNIKKVELVVTPSAAK